MKFMIIRIKKTSLDFLKMFLNFVAEAGGFEPPVRLPVRQFSKLVVSATHPNFLPFEVPGGFEPPYTVLQTAD